MDCLTLKNKKDYAKVTLSHMLEGEFTTCPLDMFETSKIVNYTNEWNVELKYNKRIDATVRRISFITTTDFFEILSVFGDDYDVAYKIIGKELK